MNRRRPGPRATVTAPRAAGATALLVAVLLALAAVGPAPGLDGSNATGDALDGSNTTGNSATDTGPEFVVTDVTTGPADSGGTTDGGPVTVTVAYATPANGTREFTADHVYPGSVDARAGWAYLPRSALPAALERGAGDPATGVVTVGPWALVGDLTAASAPVRNSRVTVVAPAGMDVDPARKAGFLAEFVSPYELHPSPPEEVTFVVAPDTLPSAGRTYGETGYITQRGFWDGDASSVWIHEYVHTRQGFDLTSEMRWFREASATYLSARLLEEQYEGVTERDVRTRLEATPDHPGTALANRSAWDDTSADYERGARLLYAVDAAIRMETDGNRTLVDVVRAMNRRDDPLTVDEFVRIVERYAGDLEWLRPSITEPGSLDDRVAWAGDVFDP